jgi:hypothetical protein
MLASITKFSKIVCAKLKGQVGQRLATVETNSVDDHFGEVRRLCWIGVKGRCSGLAQATYSYEYTATDFKAWERGTSILKIFDPAKIARKKALV